MKKTIGLFLLIFSVGTSAVQRASGETESVHALWDKQLSQYVAYSADNGAGTEVDYQRWGEDIDVLRHYLNQLESVSLAKYRNWRPSKQLAFLINAYNAYTVALILEHYPDIDSITEIGGVFSSPWSMHVGNLLGKPRTLDDIEHGMIRGKLEKLSREGFSGFDEPRIHFAVNCASRGCPPLRNEAFQAEKLNAQLAQQTTQFLGNSARNNYKNGKLNVSKIFDWYEDDFTNGWREATSLGHFLLLYADALKLDEEGRAALEQNVLPIRFMEYDWSLNENVD